MNIERIEIKQLFNYFDYSLDFSDSTRRVFMLTGPNGYGKTTILSIIDSIASYNLSFFYLIPFDFIEVSFVDNRTLSITSKLLKKNQQEDVNIEEEREVIFEWRLGGKSESSIIINRESIKSALTEIDLNRYRPDYNNILLKSTSEILKFFNRNSSIYDIIAKHQNQNQFSMLFEMVTSNFIGVQRLYCNERQQINGIRLNRERYTSNDNVFDDKSVNLAVKDISKKLLNILRDSQINFLKNSQELNNRLVDVVFSITTSCSEEDYNKKIENIEPILRELEQFSLIDKIPFKEYNSEYAKLLTAYIDGVIENTKLYLPLLKKMKAFSELLEKKKFINKKITFSPRYGLRVEVLKGNGFIDLEKLSSGEQNEIILLYHLIFEVSDNSILMIDEPENSLHVAWQNSMIDEIKQLAEVKNIQVIVATHSPVIVGERWSECIDLYENSLEDEFY